MAVYSSLRWLISITERPLPCQSRSSAWARCRTASGSAAGPAQKLKARLLTSTLAQNSGRPGACQQPPNPTPSRASALAPTDHSSLIGLSSAAASGSSPASVTAPSTLSSPSSSSSSSSAEGSCTRSRPTRVSSLASLIRVTPWVLRPRLETSLTRVHQGALVGNQHDFLAFKHLHGADQLAVTLVADHGDYALAATTATRELGHRRSLAVATLGGSENLRVGFRNQHGDDFLAFRQTHATHTASGTAHGADFAFLEANHLAAVGEHHHFAGAVSYGSGDQGVIFVQLEGDQARAARTAELHQRRLLHSAFGRSHKDVGTGRFIRGLIVGVIAFGQVFDFFSLDHYAFDIVRLVAFRRLLTQRFQVDLEHGGNALAVVQRQQVDQRTTTGGARGFRNFVGLQPVHLALAGEQQQRGVAVGDQQVLDVVLILHAGGRLALTTATLRLVGMQRLALGITTVGNGDHTLFFGDQVSQAQIQTVVENLGTARIAELGFDRFQFFADHFHQTRGAGEDADQLAALGEA